MNTRMMYWLAGLVVGHVTGGVVTTFWLWAHGFCGR